MKINCESCGSSDANHIYNDDNPRTHCFSCGKTVFKESKNNMNELIDQDDMIERSFGTHTRTHIHTHTHTHAHTHSKLENLISRIYEAKANAMGAGAAAVHETRNLAPAP